MRSVVPTLSSVAAALAASVAVVLLPPPASAFPPPSTAAGPSRRPCPAFLVVPPSNRPPAAPKGLFASADPSALLSSSVPIAGDKDDDEESDAAPQPSSSSSLSYYETLVSRFRGDFDNYEQVVRDRAAGYSEAREGGAHEHIHCTLVPLDVGLVRDFLGGDGGGAVDDDDDAEEAEDGGGGGGDNAYADWSDARLAAFYFDGSPERIFRLRLYVLRPDPIGARLRLFTLGSAAEGALRALSERPERWRDALESVLSLEGGDGADFEELVGCDVVWTEEACPTRHAYAYGLEGSPPPHLEYLPDLDPRVAQHAVMLNGECTIPSLMVPGTQIRIVDELSLWEDYLWINDRGFCPESGDFIYGNHRGVPYEMRRCAEWSDDGRSREPVQGEAGTELGWTLGRKWRTDDEYQRKMDKIGGPTAKMSGKRAGGPPPGQKTPSA